MLGSTQSQLAIALALRSGDLTATEPLLVVAQSISSGSASGSVPPLYGYTIPQSTPKVNTLFYPKLDVIRLIL